MSTDEVSQEATADPRTYAIIGAAMAIHNKLGGGFLEGVYMEALAIELQRKQIPFESEVWLPITYEGVLLKTRYRCDFLCYDEIVVEVKSVGQLAETHEAQTINYLKAGRHPLGLLMNFRGPRLVIRRFVNGDARKRAESVQALDT